NQKPVPFFVVSLKSGAKATEVKTSLDGTAEVQLPLGRWTVSSPKAAELGGKRFSWSLQVTLSGGEQNIDLTNDNAKVEETADPPKDVALLSVNRAALPNASSAPLYRPGAGRTPVQEGERVFTIGSPLSLDKIITTGIVSKVEPHTIMSDVNINPGNSGGPLF